MQLQGKTAICGVSLLVGVIGCVMGSNVYAQCFDFSKVITEPLRPPVTQNQSGTLSQGWTWAAVRGVVNQPITAVIQDLIAHRSTKSSRVDKMTLTDLHDSRYLLKQSAKMEVHPFPFVSVDWTETWAFAVTDGTRQDPKRVVVSYEKTEGTSHIEHLCGNYVLEKKPDGKTDVFIYEEAKATHRSVNDTLGGLEGNLRALNASGKR